MRTATHSGINMLQRLEEYTCCGTAIVMFARKIKIQKPILCMFAVDAVTQGGTVANG